mmetsp:Transcript_30504/g.68402  ORF Transcript_30504/g.68402 Transcript_30504/m.68402 type:complete len:237 (+) Transcript_30504:89-799(+)
MVPELPRRVGGAGWVVDVSYLVFHLFIGGEVESLLGPKLRILELLVVPRQVLFQVALGAPAEGALGLVDRNVEGGVAEGEGAFGKLESRRVVRHDLSLFSAELGSHVGDLGVRDARVGPAVEHLAHRVGVAQRRGQERGHVHGVGQANNLVTSVGDGEGHAALDAVEEPVDVVTLVGQRTVDVLRPKRGPGQAFRSEELLDSALTRLLHLVGLRHRLRLALVHARRGHEHVVGHLP